MRRHRRGRRRRRLPLDLPDLAQDHPQALLVPILSDARGVALSCASGSARSACPTRSCSSTRGLAGGHLGAAKIADLADPRFDFENAIPQSLAFPQRGHRARGAGHCRRRHPQPADIARVVAGATGAAAVQLGTPFAVTAECDAHDEFKRVLAEATDADMVEFTSVAGLPARAVATQKWLRSYLQAEARLQARPSPSPLPACVRLPGSVRAARRHPAWGQFCIDTTLVAELRGDPSAACSSAVGSLPFGTQVRGVRELVEWLLTPAMRRRPDRAAPGARR